MRARKRFGQHFLSDDGVLDRIVRSVRPQPADLLLEIGPGQGALTAWLARELRDAAPSGRYVAVEIDRDLVPFLRARFPGVEFVNADILRVDLDALFGEGRWRVVGNLPYNISTPLLVLLLGHLARIRDMHFMLQREVAERLAASPGSKAWGRITVLMQYHCVVEHLFDVAPESFTPPPRVWSAVVRITPRAEKPLVDMVAFDAVLRHAFAQRRKRLANALQSIGVDWAAAGVDPGKRADAVTGAEYVALARTLAPVDRHDPLATEPPGE
ncbi:MAG: 16S rRNA (adenine(1518)-N(6)/adenine(1519)-N(6))-dimethyltransferase RsmA [Pseudomonadales bacterium]|nr:16S rRNA (adenine(1518)-N(6)/adenine(1519)-N(6))-dimethyltransferase RsmA [Pseudomonadales bacterium]